MKYNLNFYDLCNGCYLATIASGVMLSKFPELAFEHSWDGNNYSVQDGLGNRGTITFLENSCVGAFRCEKSLRLKSKKIYSEYFQGVPTYLFELAEKETLQFLLDDIDGKIQPSITTCFWSNGDDIISNDEHQHFFENGGEIIIPQLSSLEIGMMHWRQYYEMEEKEFQLVVSLINRKIQNPEEVIFLTSGEEKILLRQSNDGYRAAKQLLSSINIY